MATENVLPEHDQLSPEAVESPRTVAVRELLKLLVKAQKAQRLYDGKNTVSERLEKDLFDRASEFLATEGEIQLVVLEFQLKCGEDVVYDSDDRNHSLAFLLYRDGVRRLSFHPGLELEELQAFMTCLNRVALLANDQDDLVTLFWEQEFHAIRYFAIEELTATDAYPRLEQQLASGELACEGAGGAEAVSLDLEQPVSTVPVEACRLDDAEIEMLQSELASEQAMPFQHLVTELAIELTLLEENEEEREELMRNLVAITDRLIADGALDELAAMEEHMDGLATMVLQDEESVRKLAASFLSELAEPARLARFLSKVDEHHAPKPEVLTAYLARMGPAATSVVLPWMGRLSSSVYRRAVTNALLVMEEGGLETIASHLPLTAPGETQQEQLEHRQLVREMLHALSHHPGEGALPVLTRMLDAADGVTRRETFVAISRYPEQVVEDLCLTHLQDVDSEIRAASLDTLVRRGKQELGRHALEQSLEARDFDERSLNEKRRLFAAVAKLCGESALDLLRQQLMGREDRWFTSRKEKELAQAVAHGIRVVGTEKARELLRHCAENGPRFVRAACMKELAH